MKVSIICITTLCGKIAPVKYLGSRVDRRFLEMIRQTSDASLIGATSLRQADPEFRDIEGNISNRIRAIITASGNIPTNKKIFLSGPKPFVFCPNKKALDLEKRLHNLANVVPLPYFKDNFLDLNKMKTFLAEHGVKSLLIEGGGSLNYHALKQKIVDELLITVAPKILGKQDEAALVSGEEVLGNPFINLELLDFKPCKVTSEVFLRYKVKKDG